MFWIMSTIVGLIAVANLVVLAGKVPGMTGSDWMTVAAVVSCSVAAGWCAAFGVADRYR